MVKAVVNKPQAKPPTKKQLAEKALEEKKAKYRRHGLHMDFPLPEWTAAERDRYIAECSLGNGALSKLIALEQEFELPAEKTKVKYKRPDNVSVYTWTYLTRGMKRALSQAEAAIAARPKPISGSEPAFGPTEDQYAVDGYVKNPPATATKAVKKKVVSKKAIVVKRKRKG